jgi:hypothetical protein
VNNPAAEQPKPNAIRDRTSEPRILRSNQPVGEDLTRIPIRREMCDGLVREYGRGTASGGQFVRIKKYDFFLPFASRLVADVTEAHCHRVELVFRPLLGPRAHECQGHGAREGGWLPTLNRAIEVRRSNTEITSTGGEQLARKLIVGKVVADRRANPAMVGLRGVGPKIDRKLGFDPK